MTATVAFCPAPSLPNLKQKGNYIALTLSSTLDSMQARVKGEPTQLFLLSKVAAAHTLVSRVVNLL